MTAPETAADIYAVHRCPGAPGPLSPHELRFDLFDLGAIIIPVLWTRKAALQGTHPVISVTLQGRRRHFRGQREFPESSSWGVNLARPQRVGAERSRRPRSPKGRQGGLPVSAAFTRPRGSGSELALPWTFLS